MVSWFLLQENGYQLLFLSARAIVQAYLTKSFLFNLKQVYFTMTWSLICFLRCTVVLVFWRLMIKMFRNIFVQPDKFSYLVRGLQFVVFGVLKSSLLYLLALTLVLCCFIEQFCTPSVWYLDHARLWYCFLLFLDCANFLWRYFGTLVDVIIINRIIEYNFLKMLAGWEKLTQWTCCYFPWWLISIIVPRRWDPFPWRINSHLIIYQRKVVTLHIIKRKLQ